jgi:hypothetical protein
VVTQSDRQAAERAVSDALIDATSIGGTPEQCRERIEAYRQSGIDLPILSPYARGPGVKASSMRRSGPARRSCYPTKSSRQQLFGHKEASVRPVSSPAWIEPQELSLSAARCEFAGSKIG